VPSKPFPTSGADSLPEDRALDLHTYLIERVHQGLHPDLEDLVHELLDCLLRLRTRRVMRDRRSRYGRRAV
jgi:hypothetical protein